MIKKLLSRLRYALRPPSDNVPVDSRNCGLFDAVLSGWYQPDTGELFKGFPIRAEDRVLDFGCGDGGATLYAARQGAAVIFADSDADKIEGLKNKVRATSAREFRGIVSEGDRLPLPDASVNKVIVMEVLEHVEDPRQVLAELVRVAMPGAQFLISVPDAAAETLQKIVAPPAHFQSPNHIHIFQRDEFSTLVTKTGLVIEQCHYTGFYWSLWMCFYWAAQRASHAPQSGATLDKIAPPYHPLLDLWASTWQTFISMPESAELRAALDHYLPKSQIIIAQKPLP